MLVMGAAESDKLGVLNTTTHKSKVEKAVQTGENLKGFLFFLKTQEDIYEKLYFFISLALQPPQAVTACRVWPFFGGISQ